MAAIWPWSHLVNLAAFDRIADAIGDVTFAAKFSDRLTFCSASATFSANAPLGC